MKSKIFKVLGVMLSLALCLSFVAVAPVSAAPGVNAWDDIALPSTEWENTNVTLLAFDGDVMYGAVEDQWGDWALVKSTDGGFTWDETVMGFDWYDDNPDVDDVGGIVDDAAIMDIVVSPSGDGTVYVAFETLKSTRSWTIRSPLSMMLSTKRV